MRWAARGVGLLALAGALVALCLLEYPVVLGRWEAVTNFPMMIGSGPPLSFEITPGGFIASRSRYALVNLGYYTAEWLGWSLAAFRLPVLVPGAASVALFAVVAGRAFGFWPALASAALLALNPMFLVFWHQQIVSMVTMVFLVLVIERYQALEGRPRESGAPTLGGADAGAGVRLSADPPRPGRVVRRGVDGLLGGAVTGWRALQDAPGRTADRPSAAAGAAGVRHPGRVIALLMDPRNARYLISPTELLLAPQSEFIRRRAACRRVENVPVMLQALVPPLPWCPTCSGISAPTCWWTSGTSWSRLGAATGAARPGVLIGRARRSRDAQLTLCCCS